MSEFHLDDRQFRAALTVLRREQEAFLPSRAELQRYRSFTLAVRVWLLLVAALVVLHALGTDWAREARQLLDRTEGNPFMVLLAAVAVVACVLLGRNRPLIEKLRGHARLRRRLGLQRRLRPTLRSWLFSRRGVLFGLEMLAFWVLALIMGAFLLILAGKLEEALQDIGLSALFALAAGLACISLALFSHPLVRAAKDRLDMVLALERALEPVAEPSDSKVARALAPTKAFEIADLESSQIMIERDRSLRDARAWSLVESRDVRRWKVELGTEERMALDRALLELLESPPDPPEGERSMRVAGLEIDYRVEVSSRTIRIVALKHVAGEGEGSSA